jgi:hypothetical protein
MMVVVAEVVLLRHPLLLGRRLLSERQSAGLLQKSAERSALLLVPLPKRLSAIL